MEFLFDWIVMHGYHAHWYVFLAMLLAGINLPICIDLVVLAAAFLAAQLPLKMVPVLFLAVFVGAYVSAACSYWIGRLLGKKILAYPRFAKLVFSKKIWVVDHFHTKQGVLGFVACRFIPFGVRNCLFMALGLNKIDFVRFMWVDACACFVWCLISFFSFYAFGSYYKDIFFYIKTINLYGGILFVLAIIGLLWYTLRNHVPESLSKG